MEITQDLDYALMEGEQLGLQYDSSRGAGYGRRIQLLAETTEQTGDVS